MVANATRVTRAARSARYTRATRATSVTGVTRSTRVIKVSRVKARGSGQPSTEQGPENHKAPLLQNIQIQLWELGSHTGRQTGSCELPGPSGTPLVGVGGGGGKVIKADPFSDGLHLFAWRHPSLTCPPGSPSGPPQWAPEGGGPAVDEREAGAVFLLCPPAVCLHWVQPHSTRSSHCPPSPPSLSSVG